MEVGIEQTEEIWLRVTVAIACCTLVTLCVICFGERVRDDGQLWLSVCLITTAGIPLLIGILENILRLIGLGIITALIMTVFWVFSHGETETNVFSTLSSKPSGCSGFSGVSANPHHSSQKHKNTEFVDRSFLGCMVYRVHGIMHDYIVYDNGVGTREICSLDDLRKGKFHIIDKATKRAIQEHEIPWKR